MSTCPYCGWPDHDVVETVSRHGTEDGLTVWTRCACGSLQVRAVTAGSVTVTARGRPRATDSVPGRHSSPAPKV
ncbi:hypothetical protein [Streptomyces reniochalinae]|uniref:Uncharacterized protein n=1 Tax=Streptomyces reniochalinae TaxID=2250578 RepID=A0A367F648_9ACTN|nr:hypothetical protein [Streptomyces reniochalinae]RCG25721.1 hypothetical protein DQ392_00245 [Streptomyces reniochalinae]